MKQNIFDEYVNSLKARINPEKTFFSPYKRNCLILYNGKEIYNSVWFYDFSILFTENDNVFEVFSYDKSISCWDSPNVVYWSKDSNYCAISVSMKYREKNISYEGKLLIDIEKKLYTLFHLAGAREYQVKFTDNVIETSTKKADFNKEYIEILNKKTDMKVFKWLPLSEINKTHELYNTGYFGNLVGYKNEEKNIYFKNSKNEWPYDDIDV